MTKRRATSLPIKARTKPSPVRPQRPRKLSQNRQNRMQAMRERIQQRQSAVDQQRQSQPSNQTARPSRRPSRQSKTTVKPKTNRPQPKPKTGRTTRPQAGIQIPKRAKTAGRLPTTRTNRQRTTPQRSTQRNMPRSTQRPAQRNTTPYQRQSAQRSAGYRQPTSGGQSAAYQQELQYRLSAVQREFNSLQDDISLISVHDDMGRIESVLVNLDSDLDQLRSEGYVFRNYMEQKIDVLIQKWETITDGISQDVEQESQWLTSEASQVSQFMNQMMMGQSNIAALSQAETAVRSLSSKVATVRSGFQRRYDDLARTIYQTRAQLDEVKWSFEQASLASFDFLEAEYLILACDAEMLEDMDNDEGPKGLLFLTDERLIFEQKETVATKKFLFVTTESELVQELRFETLLEWIDEVKVQDKSKFLSARKELLDITLSDDAPFNYATFRLHEGAKNEDWAKHIKRAQTQEIDKERIAEAAAEKEAADQKLAELPTTCPVCGAPFPEAVTKGQDSITCEYCGSVTRL